MNTQDAYSTIKEIALKTNLYEGPEGVEKILRNINQVKGVPLHDLSKRVAIPIPVIVAVRKELEKLGLLTRDSGLALTQSGKILLEDIGVYSSNQFFLNSGYVFPELFEDIKLELEQISQDRPKADYTLDQSHVNSTTAIMRAAYLFHHDAVEGRKILFLGDDDLTSIAVFLLSKKLGSYPKNITVIDLDRRILDFIEIKINTNKFDYNFIYANLIDPMDLNLVSQFDVFFTDPPYTMQGFKLFVSRGVEALKNETGKYGFINFPSRAPDDTAELLTIMSDMGLAVQEIVNGFNDYIGAQIHSGKSNMIRIFTSSTSKPLIVDGSLPIYTASRK